VDYIHEIGLAPKGTPVLQHAGADGVRNRHVIGVLPLHLASAAETVTEIPLNLPANQRGVELSLEEVRRYAGTPRTYRVSEVVEDL